MALVDSNAEAAIKYANDWIYSIPYDGIGKVSTSIPAGHCKALGLLATGRAVDAAQMLERLVDDMIIQGDENLGAMVKNARLRVQLHSQAALAWKEAGDFDKSYMAYSSALAGTRKDNARTRNQSLYRELYLERGTLQILRGQYTAAIEDLTRAIDRDETQFDGFLQRAKAYRKRRAFLKARLDLRIALKLAADQPDIMLESGILYRTEGKKLEARLDWQKIIDLYPKSEFAELAQMNIDLLQAD